MQIEEINIGYGKTVLLHFGNCNRPETAQLGYINFKMELYIPRPLHCFKCSRFSHVAVHCKGKVRCSTCSAAHKSKIVPQLT